MFVCFFHVCKFPAIMWNFDLKMTIIIITLASIVAYYPSSNEHLI